MQKVLTRVWDWLSEDKRLWQLILVILIPYLFTLILPQSPVATHNAATFSRWLAELQPTLGPNTKLLAQLGLLSVRTSVWFRALLVLLVLVTVARSLNLLTQWQTLVKSRRLWLSIVCISSVLFIAGWSLQTLWGWSEPDIIAWAQSDIILTEHDIVLPPTQANFPLFTSKFGLYLLPHGRNRVLIVKSLDGENTPLMLSQAVHSTPKPVLKFTFTVGSPEAYFTAVGTDLIFRVVQLPGEASDLLQLQIYRSASGELLDDLMLDAMQHISISGVELILEPATQPRFSAVYNPGAPLQVVGGVLFMIGSWVVLMSAKKEAEEVSDLVEEDGGVSEGVSS